MTKSETIYIVVKRIHSNPKYFCPNDKQQFIQKEKNKQQFNKQLIAKIYHC